MNFSCSEIEILLEKLPLHTQADENFHNSGIFPTSCDRHPALALFLNIAEKSCNHDFLLEEEDPPFSRKKHEFVLKMLELQQ